MALTFIERQGDQYGDLSAEYERMHGHFRDKLWHQLTDSVLSFVSNDDHVRGDNMRELYTGFVTHFVGRINRLAVARILVAVAERECPAEADPARLSRAVELLTSQMEEKPGQFGEMGKSAVQLELCLLRLRLGEVDEAKALLTTVTDELATVDDLPPYVSAMRYRAAAEIAAVRGPPHAFFSNALRFLVHTPLAELSEAEQRRWAMDTAIAALVADDVFSFGEIANHDVLKSLDGTGDAWLCALLRTFQTGDIDAFAACVDEHRAAFDGVEALRLGEDMLKQKITIVAVMEMVAKRPSHEWTFSFAEVAEATRLPEEEVEWILMRAMSLGLLRGEMDQVDGIVHVSYVRPRVLSKEQIGKLEGQIGTWARRVHDALVTVEARTQDLLE